MNERHLVASNAMTGGTLLTHPVRSNDLNDARARRRNLLRNDEDRVCARSAQLLRVSAVGSLTGAPQPEANGSAQSYADSSRTNLVCCTCYTSQIV